MSTKPAVDASPLTRKGLETRERIVEAAAQLIFEKGANQTTIDDVRHAANASSSQLYHYFKDKPALIRAVAEHQVDAILGGQAQFDLSSVDGFRAWRTYVVEHQRSLNCEGGCPIGSLGGQLAESEPEARAAIAKGFQRWGRAFQNGLEAMQAYGRLEDDLDVEQLALTILAVLQGGLLLAQIERNTKALEAGLDNVISQIESGRP